MNYDAMSYAQLYAIAVREARRQEIARIDADRRETAERVARTIAANGGKPFRCPHPTAVALCVAECRGCCTLSYTAPPKDSSDHPAFAVRASATKPSAQMALGFQKK